MSEPNERERKYKADEVLPVIEQNAREEIEARLKGETMAPNPYTDSRESRPKYAEGHAEATPAQAREDEALLELPRYNPRPAYGTNALQDMRPDPQYGQWVRWSELQVALATLRSRQSPQAEDEVPWRITPPDQNGEYGVWAGKTHCVAEGLTLEKAQELIATHAAAPQPSPQGEDSVGHGVEYTPEQSEALRFAEGALLQYSTKRDDAGWCETLGSKVARTLYEMLSDAILRSRLASAQSSAQGEEARDGADALCRERERQKSVEGWTPEHDDEHSGGELAEAGAAYAIGRADLFPKTWSIIWWKVPRKADGTIDRKRELEKAGALIAAEWDRLDRLEARAALERKEAK